VTAPTRTPTEARSALHGALAELFAARRRLRGRDAQQKAGITHAQMHLLHALARECGGLPASRLAACADLTPTTVTQMVDGLARHRLVERERSEHDRRVVLVSLTAAGRAAYERQRVLYERRSRELLADMSAEELDQAAEVLRRIARMLDGL
jgi:DNA-binding MarR family transcriptional regulator